MRYQYLKFNGEDGSMGFIKGATYKTSVHTRTKPQRLAGILIGIPYSWEVIVASPKMIPYESWYSFRQNWEPTNEVGAIYKTIGRGLTGMES